MAEASTPSFSATDLIAIMKVAAETGVLSMRLGEVEFTRTGYTPKATPQSQLETILEQAAAAQSWSEAPAPADAFEKI